MTQKLTRLLVERTGEPLAIELKFAKSMLARMKGLLGRDRLGPGEALWIEPCNSIHTMFMRFAIDAVFLDRDGVVLKRIHGLKPWRASTIVPRARTVIELEVGALARAGLRDGDKLIVQEPPES